MRMTQLKTIADIQTGPFGSQLHKEDYVETGTPIVTVEHLGNRVFTEQNLPRVSDSDKARLIKYTLSTGDIVFSRVGSVDRCSYVDKSHDGWMFSGRCLRVRPTELVPFPVSWTVKMKKKQKETQDILSYHTQAAGCSDKARAKASGGRQPIEECGRTGL